MTGHSTHLIDAALKLLGIRTFALAIHDSCFPSTPDEDIGRGSPYGRGGSQFFQFARRLGFNTIQLGPQGKTPRDDPSPYNSTIFSKSILSLAASTLADNEQLNGLILPGDLGQLISELQLRRHEYRSDRLDYRAAWEVSHRLLDLAHERFLALRNTKANVVVAFHRYLAQRRQDSVNWFERDSLFEAISTILGEDWKLWVPDFHLFCHNAEDEGRSCRRIQQILKLQERIVERFALGQFLLQQQHEQLRTNVRDLGLRIFGDMHIGCAHQDWWAWQSLFLPEYLLGAPPSRTNPLGQPWGYPILDPRKIRSLDSRGKTIPGPALAFVRGRAEKLLADFDGIRIDHPQGLVCPWVYRTDDPDPLHAVQNGARLYSSPDRIDHPELREFSIVRPDQLHPDPNYPRYADEHVIQETLSPEQIDRYAVILDTVIEAAKSAGGTTDDILCEVLSTWPAPLKAVMQQRGMGRFCVTQKADPHDPDDVYRPEKTAPGDWIMIGNHDTKPLWRLVDERKSSDWMYDRATLLAERLAPESIDRQTFAVRLASEPRRFCEAMFAELFLGPAQNVSIFFADLFGEKRLYNDPGTVGEDNWTLRVPPGYDAIYTQRVQRGESLHIGRALAMALEAKAAALGPEAIRLVPQLRNLNP